ncbi:MAG: peptide-N4-asparagine amidase, partial [Nitrososphaerota archaeon]
MKKRIWIPLIALPLLIVSVFAGYRLMPTASAETVYQDSVTAAPPVSRPNTASCAETIVSHSFAFSYGSPFVSSYAPPANCSGPWSKVVL